MRLTGCLPSGKNSLFADDKLTIVGNRIVVKARPERGYTGFALELTPAEIAEVVETFMHLNPRR